MDGGHRRQKSWKESVMKCSNPDCNRGIGLVVYRRGWFSKRRYCSKHCRDAFVADATKLQQERSVTTYFEWLCLQPIENSHEAEASSRRYKGTLRATKTVIELPTSVLRSTRPPPDRPDRLTQGTAEWQKVGALQCH